MAVAWKSEQGLHSGKLTVTFRDGCGGGGGLGVGPGLFSRLYSYFSELDWLAVRVCLFTTLSLWTHLGWLNRCPGRKLLYA